MKKINIYISILLLFLLSSCLKDKGNYDYQNINEIKITGLNTTYNGRQNVDTIRITPAIEMTQEVTEGGRLLYFWVAKKGTNVVDTVGRERNLNYAVKLAPDNYTLELRLLDQKTNVTWTTKTNLNIGTAFSRGWLLAGDNEQGNADLDMIAMVGDTSIIKGILTNSGLPTLKGGLNAWHSSGEAAYIKMWVSTKSGSYYLDRISMKGKEADRFGKFVYTTEAIDKDKLNPIVFGPQTVNINGSVGGYGANWRKAVITDNGTIFTSYVISNADYYGNPINRVDNKMWPATPSLLYSLGNMESLVWYDKANERFLNYPSFTGAPSSSVLADKEEDPFPWNQSKVGRTFVYGENTRNTDGGSNDGNSFAVLKDNAGKHFIYKFYAKGATPAKRNAYEIKSIATDIDKADFFAFSSRRTVMFYSVKNKLYAYDYNLGNERIYSFPEEITGAEITMLKFDTQIDAGTNSLYIATYDAATKGTLQRFDVGVNPNFVDITPVAKSKWSNLLKIKNINWRAIN